MTLFTPLVRIYDPKSLKLFRLTQLFDATIIYCSNKANTNQLKSFCVPSNLMDFESCFNSVIIIFIKSIHFVNFPCNL